jgi:hypothetical protein
MFALFNVQVDPTAEQVACPGAASLAPQRIAVHWMTCWNTALYGNDTLASRNFMMKFLCWLHAVQVACPVAASLAPQRIAVHWMSSNSLLELLPPLQQPTSDTSNKSNTAAASRTRLQLNLPPACAAPNIEFWARLGSAAYGMSAEGNAQLPGVRPVLRWTSRVTRVSNGCVTGAVV